MEQVDLTDSAHLSVEACDSALRATYCLSESIVRLLEAAASHTSTPRSRCVASRVCRVDCPGAHSIFSYGGFVAHGVEAVLRSGGIVGFGLNDERRPGADFGGGSSGTVTSVLTPSPLFPSR